MVHAFLFDDPEGLIDKLDRVKFEVGKKKKAA